MPVDNASTREALLGFADAMEARGAAEGSPAPGPELHLLTFALDREEYAVPISQVREVIRVGDLTRVPEAPQHIRGVTNLRGRILPVVELRSRLGLAPLDTPGPRARIIVVETDGRILGLLVDSVSHVLKVTAGMVIDAPAEVTSAQGNYVTGVARIDSRLVILLDLDRALLPALA